MKKNAGSALIDYVIPTALIGLVCGVSLYYMVSDGKLLGFIGASANMDINMADQMAVIGNKKPDGTSILNNLAGGSLGGTPDNPVEKCTDGTCMIDYGEFILNGVPENFSEVVQSTGTSGGTDSLVSLVKQIADQLEQNGKINESLEVRKLASLGHNIATLEKEYEKIAIGCNKDVTCIQNYNSQIIPKPAGYDEAFYPYVETTLIETATKIPIGITRRWQLKEPASYNYLYSRNYPSALFVDKYQSLMDETNLSDTQKGVIKELYWQIGKLSEDVEAGTHIAENAYSQDYCDPFTGEYTPNPDLPENPFDIYSGYKPSSMTHVDSALICAAGYNQDTGTKCH